MLRYALERLALAKVQADVDEPNVESVRVLEKLGMRCVKRKLVDRSASRLVFHRQLK